MLHTLMVGTLETLSIRPNLESDLAVCSLVISKVEHGGSQTWRSICNNVEQSFGIIQTLPLPRSDHFLFSNQQPTIYPYRSLGHISLHKDMSKTRMKREVTPSRTHPLHKDTPQKTSCFGHLPAQRLEDKVRESQSKPSYKPSPVVAHADWMNHWRWRKLWSPSFSVTSAAVIAWGRSCLFAKTSSTASRISSSLSILVSSSRASSMRSRSLLSTT